MTASALLESRREKAESFVAPLPVGHGPRTVRVALAGCGVVGGALVRLIEDEAPSLASRFGLRLELTRVLVRDVGRERAVSLVSGVLTDDVESFIAAPSDIVVEAIGGTGTSHHIATAALALGKRFVCANKALIAAHGPSLSNLAAVSGGTIDFEAAVGGAIPVVRTLRETLCGIGVSGIRGVLNGTCNFILDRVADGDAYETALAEAQRLGFAEPDPSRDLSGLDAADKVRVLAWLAFGIDPARLSIHVRGIGLDPAELVATAYAAGGVARLIGECVLTDDGVVANVEPFILRPGSELGRVRDENNAFVIDSQSAGRMLLAGRGAGGVPTAGAIYADILRAALRPRSSRQNSGFTPRLREHKAHTPSFVPAAREDTRALRWLLRTDPSSLGEVAQACLATGIRFDGAPIPVTYDFCLLPITATRRALLALSRDPSLAGCTIDSYRWEP